MNHGRCPRRSGEPGAAEAVALGGGPRAKRGPRLRALPPAASRLPADRFRADRRRRRLDRRLGRSRPTGGGDRRPQLDPAGPGRRAQSRGPGRHGTLDLLPRRWDGPSSDSRPTPVSRPSSAPTTTTRPPRASSASTATCSTTSSINTASSSTRSGRPIRSGPAAGRSAATSFSNSAGSTPDSIPARRSRTSSWATA